MKPTTYYSQALILLMLCLFFSTAYAQSDKNPYSMKGSDVYYQNDCLQAADACTFQILGHGYAKDCHHVYLHGRILPYVDPASFRLKHTHSHADEEEWDERESAYHVSTFTVYYQGRKVQNASSNSFQVLGGGYAKDSFRVYYAGEEIAGASAVSFVYDGKGYGHDAFNTFYRGRKLPD